MGETKTNIEIIDEWKVPINKEYVSIVDKGIAPIKNQKNMVYLKPRNKLPTGAYALIHLESESIGKQVFGNVGSQKAYYHYKFFIHKKEVLENKDKYCMNKVLGKKGESGWSKWMSKTQDTYKLKKCNKVSTIDNEKMTDQSNLKKYPKLSQRNVTNYSNSTFPNEYDTIPHSKQKEKIKNLACAATVYTMIERGLNNKKVYIDEFYKKGPGAIRPDYVSKDMKLNTSIINYSLSKNKPVILHGYGGPLKEHFVLLLGKTETSNHDTQYIIYDPYSKDGQIKLNIPISKNIKHPKFDITFKQMRLVDLDFKKIGIIENINNDWNFVTISLDKNIKVRKNDILFVKTNEKKCTLNVKKVLSNKISAISNDCSLYSLSKQLNVYNIR